MILSYRTRKFFRGLATFLLLAALAAAVVWMVWIVWLDRFVVYTRDGAQFRFDSSAEDLRGEVAVPPEALPGVSIVYDDSDPEQSVSTELTQLKGYYADVEALTGDLAAVREQIEKLPTGTPVMVDVKTIYGAFNYSSSVSTSRNSQVDSQEMDSLIQDLAASGRYLIARLPGLRDKEFGLNHVDDGVFHSSRGYLYMDDQGCYWLNPAREATVTHLTQIVNELKGMGFDEVVFYDFTFPATDSIYFDGDKAQALSTTAQTLVTTCSTESFAVSFVSSEGFQPPEGRSRLYLENAAAADAANIAQNSGLEDPTAKLVFLTDNHDTRFDAYSVLRPLATAH